MLMPDWYPDFPDNFDQSGQLSKKHCLLLQQCLADYFKKSGAWNSGFGQW